MLSSLLRLKMPGSATAAALTPLCGALTSWLLAAKGMVTSAALPVGLACSAFPLPLWPRAASAALPLVPLVMGWLRLSLSSPQLVLLLPAAMAGTMPWPTFAPWLRLAFPPSVPLLLLLRWNMLPGAVVAETAPVQPSYKHISGMDPACRLLDS